LLYIPIALDIVVLAAHQDLTVDSLSTQELEKLISGASSQFSDGSPASVLLRDRSDSAHSAFEKQVPSLRLLRENAYDSRRFRVIFHDDAMGATLASSPGCVGVFSLGAIASWKLPLKVLSIDGIVPNLEHAQDGSWRAVRELAFVVRPENRERFDAFFRFIDTDQARALIRASGYLPIRGKTP
jgi:phosphate transport system substrate-binding protein